MEGKHDADTTIVHILEELGEIAREIYNEKIGRDEIDKENLEGEFADVMILLSVLAANYDIDLEKSINKKITTLKERHGV